MAERAQPLGLWVWAGGAAAGLLLTLSLAPIAAVLARAGEAGGLGPADWAAVRFTLVQASLSATLSVLFAVPLARALARRSFRGRRLLVTVLGAPFILPVIVAVLGLVAVYGRSGWISGLLAHLGQGPVDIYGLAGVALAHVFFNLPLATRLILQEWAHVPGEHLRLAAALGFRST
ncbi:MAG: thiamine/thiamine pyrophosphate ABC transporter permease ThiP, partial [Pseudomonadota bacterium]